MHSPHRGRRQCKGKKVLRGARGGLVVDTRGLADYPFRVLPPRSLSVRIAVNPNSPKDGWIDLKAHQNIARQRARQIFGEWSGQYVYTPRHSFKDDDISDLTMDADLEDEIETKLPKRMLLHDVFKSFQFRLKRGYSI